MITLGRVAALSKIIFCGFPTCQILPLAVSLFTINELLAKESSKYWLIVCEKDKQEIRIRENESSSFFTGSNFKVKNKFYIKL